MDIALLNIRITIQKHTVVTDEIGNRSNAWVDFHTCAATASGENGSAKGSEEAIAGLVVDHADVCFTVRWCRKLEAVTTDGYRVLFGGEIYNIAGIDHMNYKRKAYKLRCKKVER